MPLLAELAHAVAYEAALSARVLHVVLARPGEQMIFVDAQRDIAAMTGVVGVLEVDALRYQHKPRDLTALAFVAPHGIFFPVVFPACDHPKPDQASRIWLGDAVRFHNLADARLSGHAVRARSPLAAARCRKSCRMTAP